jgi:uncharacterized membrane protein YhaH (DUF805 family)
MDPNSIDVDALQAMMETIGFVVGLGFIFVLALILLVNRRNMNGWDLPVSYVWFALSGRINRKTYWLTGVVGIFLVEALYHLVINGTLLFASGMWPISEVILSMATLATMIPFMVFMMWTSIALSFKRVHDRNRSAWFLLIGLIPLIGAIWLLIELGFLRGTPGENRFGPEQPNVSGRTPQARKSTSNSVPDIDETPSNNLNELPNRDMIAARLGNDFLGPETPDQDDL